MTENTLKSTTIINSVDGFNPAEFTRSLPNEDGTTSLYLDVKYRLLWFRLHRPNGKIDAEIIRVDDQSAIVSCRLYADKSDPADQYVARSCAQRFLSQEKFGDRYLEIAETAALGRVLAAAGYGTQFCGSSDMLAEVIADAPIDVEPVPEPPLPSRVAPAAPNAPTIAAVPAPAIPKTLDDYLNTMTLEDAKNVVVDIGRYSGSTLGQIILQKPGDLEWYVKYYAGKNLALKAGAILLLQAATSKAG